MKSLPSAGLSPNLPTANRLRPYRLLPVLLALVLLAASGALPAAAAPRVAAAPSSAGSSPAAAADASALEDLATWLLRLVVGGGPGHGPDPAAPPILERTGGPIGPLIDPNGQSSEPPGAPGVHGNHGGPSDGNRGY